METKKSTGHLLALLSVAVWGTTFISTKVLLTAFQPVEILFFRFTIAFLALLVVCPRRMRAESVSRELTFAAAGLCGVTLYFLLENIALTYTMASNVGVIISTAPFFTALLSRVFDRTEDRLGAGFFAGFVLAIAGIALISFNGSRLQLSPKGDLLTVLAALAWACYSILTKRISRYGHSVLLTTRRIFFYGLIFVLPVLPTFNFSLDLGRFTGAKYLLNILYLGLGASAACFVTWNFAVKVLGAVKTSVYIYMTPVITTVTSVLILGEPLTWLLALGTALTVAGLFLSELSGRGAKKEGMKSEAAK